jgi:heme-degrading monooxygenase HmoA
MLVERVEIVVLGGREAAFEAVLCEVRQRVFTSQGFRGFMVAQGVERPSTYLVQVLWETREELADFTESGRFERCWAPVEPFLAGRLSVDHFVGRPSLALQGPGVLTDMAWLAE